MNESQHFRIFNLNFPRARFCILLSCWSLFSSLLLFRVCNDNFCFLIPFLWVSTQSIHDFALNLSLFGYCWTFRTLRSFQKSNNVAKGAKNRKSQYWLIFHKIINKTICGTQNNTSKHLNIIYYDINKFSASNLWLKPSFERFLKNWKWRRNPHDILTSFYIKFDGPFNISQLQIS